MKVANRKNVILCDKITLYILGLILYEHWDTNSILIVQNCRIVYFLGINVDESEFTK